MSTDRRTARAGTRYRRAVVATVGVLALATAALGIAGAFRGPHLDDATVAAATALERPGQRLVLNADQAIDAVDAADVTITPDLPIDVSSDGRVITIRFLGMLRALTEYRVSVGVTGSATGVAGTLEYAFRTPDLDIAVLLRDADGPDEVRHRAVSGEDAEVLFSAERIQEFALARIGVAAVVLGDTGSEGRLLIAPPDGAAPIEVPLPEPGRLQGLRASATTGFVGVQFTATDPDGPVAELLLFDPTGPSGLPTVVTGLDGQPVSALDWRFVPGTAYLVVQTFDQSLLLIDTAAPDAVPVPLGEHAELRGFLPGTLSLVVADPLSGSTIDLETGDTTPLTLPDDDLDAGAYPGKIVALGPESYVEVVSRPDADFVLDYEVLRVDAAGVGVIYDPDAGVPIRDVCLSPNAQYLAVEVQDPDGESDDDPNVPGRSGTTTYFVDLESGSANRGMLGFATSWCD